MRNEEVSRGGRANSASFTLRCRAHAEGRGADFYVARNCRQVRELRCSERNFDGTFFQQLSMEFRQGWKGGITGRLVHRVIARIFWGLWASKSGQVGYFLACRDKNPEARSFAEKSWLQDDEELAAQFYTASLIRGDLNVVSGGGEGSCNSSFKNFTWGMKGDFKQSWA